MKKRARADGATDAADNVGGSKRIKTDPIDSDSAHSSTHVSTLESQPTVSIIGDHSRFIEDFCNTSFVTSYELAHQGGQVIPSDPEKPNKGLESFAIMFTGLCELDELIREVLPYWKSLRKLAISHTSKLKI